MNPQSFFQYRFGGGKNTYLICANLTAQGNKRYTAKLTRCLEHLPQMIGIAMYLGFQLNSRQFTSAGKKQRPQPDLHVQRQRLVWLSALVIELSSCIKVPTGLIVHGCPHTVLAAGIAAHKPHIGIHLSMRLCDFKCLLGLLCQQQELHCSLQRSVDFKTSCQV